MSRPFYLLCATKPEASEIIKTFSLEKITDTRPPTFESYHLFSEKPMTLIRLFQTGMGLKRVVEILDSIFVPSLSDNLLVVQFGLTGALREVLQVGDILLPDRFLMEGEEPVDADPALLAQSEGILKGLKCPFYRGGLLTSSVVLGTPERKKKAAAAHDAWGVDMETYPVARRCRDLNLPFLSVRAVFDPVDWDLTALDENQVITPAGDVDYKELMKNIAEKPKLLMSLPQFQSAASKANKAIAAFLEKALNEWA